MEAKKTRMKIRKGYNNDLDGIYNCHLKCFDKGDLWYKSIIQQSMDGCYVVEKVETGQIIAVLLQGSAIPCEESEKENFKQITPTGDILVKNNLHMDYLEGILMLCVDPEFRNKGLGKMLIEIHLNENKNELVYLITRKSNKAYNLYLRMGYEHVATIKDKYFFPNEDGYFLIKNN